MPGPILFLLAGGILALIGWAAWTISRAHEPIRSGPEDTAYQRALNALLAGEEEQALVELKEAVREDSDNVDAYVHLGNLLRERGEPERALSIHRELTVRAGQTGAQQKAVREGLVLDLIALGRAAEAVEEARALRELDRRNGTSLRLLEKAHEAAGQWERAFEARAERHRLSGERDQEALALYRAAIGETLIRSEKLDEAKHHFKEALRLQRNLPAALLRLGDIYYRHGRTERALLLWRGIADTHPDLAHLVLGRLEVAYFEKGQMSEMGRAYEEILSKNPRDARTLVALARMHAKRGDLGDAQRMLNEALEVDPQSLAARLELSNVHRRRGELTRALDEMEALLRGMGQADAFVCRRCRAPSDEYWVRCPGCGAWAPYA
jgi:lipopolysaccharide biosynthesis regulator YciM